MWFHSSQNERVIEICPLKLSVLKTYSYQEFAALLKYERNPLQKNGKLTTTFYREVIREWCGII